MAKVCILLATYNGEKFLKEQIISIVNQTYTDWELLISDDMSSDGTIPLVKAIAESENRIKLVSQNEKFGSPSRNFSFLAQKAISTEAQYFFFCDQDDIWHYQKLEELIKQFIDLGNSKPVLLHHDLQVVDESANIIHPSFITMSNIPPLVTEPFQAVLRNSSTGCAMAINRALLELATPFPQQIIIHDWWLFIMANYTGEVYFLNRCLVQYRQHSNNVIGAKSFWSGLKPNKKMIAGWINGNRDFEANVKQSQACYKHLLKLDKPILDYELKKLKVFSKILNAKKQKRIYSAFKLGLSPNIFLLKVIFYLRLLLISKS